MCTRPFTKYTEQSGQYCAEVGILQAKREAIAFPLLSSRTGTLWLLRGLAGSTEGAQMCQWGRNEDAKLCLMVPFPQGTWMTMDYPTGSVPSPTPPRTDLRGTLFTEKKTDGASSSSLMAGSIQSFVLLCYIGGWVPNYFIWRNDTNEIM